MELVKVNESVNRKYEGEVATEEVTSVSYTLMENSVNVGSVNVSNGYVSLNSQMSGTMDELKAKVEAWFAK